MNGSDVPFVRAIRGPVTLITVGVLFALNNFTSYRFNQTWPVILIVFGLLSLLSRGAGSVPRREQPVIRPGFPPYGFPPPPETPTYRQSTYTVTDSSSAPAKGGFGTSAPPRSNDAGPTPPPGDSV
jgi:LiaI-LiaF-like transmembrane region